MKRIVIPVFAGIFLLSFTLVIKKTRPTQSTSSQLVKPGSEEETEENEYENLDDRYKQEFEQMRDPALGFVPSNRLIDAINSTKNARTQRTANSQGFNWSERGPIYDSVGPSNGNGRGGGTGVTGGYTAGIIQTFLLDTIADPSGNTIFVGSPSGGLWKCTNLLSAAVPNWQPVNDFMANLAISSITRNPASPNIMYLSTGDANTRDVAGTGVWKSTDYGVTWNVLPSSLSFTTSFKILCDNAGNIYLGTGGNGLQRSTNGGTSWTSISPSGLTGTNPGYVTDIELSSTGRFHAVFGYYGTSVQHFYTDVPATVSSTSGWAASTGIRLNTSVACSRIELATQGNVLYAVTGNSAYNIDSSYKSIDGGATWTKQNAAIYTSGLGSGQVWYASTLQINPDDNTQFIAGGLDAYLSTNSGSTISRLTYWVSTVPYVHADHHWMQWYKQGGESRIIIGCDGGLFLSRDGGTTWVNRNQNLAFKQFYSCAVDPTAGSNYIFAGAQDNGCHQIKNAGKTYSFETTGGDGAYVHINQQNPLIQFGSYVYNQYRRSVNGGQTWTSINPSSSLGYFINPFDYDDAQNIMYASNNSYSAANNQFRRWLSANTTSTTTTIALAELARAGVNGNVSAVTVSPYTANLVFFGGNNGRLLKLDNANTVTTATESASVTDITGASFPAGYINSIAVGTSDQYLVAVFSNYGVSNLWYSTNGGTSWTAIDGNLPDMPVWTAVFAPGSNTSLIIGTETGVYSTRAINGASTVWTAHSDFPLVRTRMLMVRASDRTIAAATYGRGLWTATVPFPLPVNLTEFTGKLQNETARLSWTTSSEQATKDFEVEKSTDGNLFYKVGVVKAAGYSNTPKDYSLIDSKLSPLNYYRLKMVDANNDSKLSNVVLIKFNVAKQQAWVINNPFESYIDLRFATNFKQAQLQLLNVNGQIVAERTIRDNTLQWRWNVPGNLPNGSYLLKIVLDDNVVTEKIIKR